MCLFSQEAIRGCGPPKWDLSEQKFPRQHVFKRIEIGKWKFPVINLNGQPDSFDH